MSVVNFLVNLHVLRIAEERWTLALWGLAQPFFYAHILTFTTLRSGLLYIRKGEARWDKLARAGHNEVPFGARMTAEDAALAA